ncbi:bcl-2-related ovarian killer protein homolog B-like isoform X1 [Thalassophryne amazonica]|uniref:bcl-2-related ovarian killer protein homolog B-like isoform X1 n=1 Tax=Thalassophryne amazonica TaxID=390379 RepID=UPI001471C6AD|nr:bcl-2-related ovarian killer protein homolog B-like isoform X1 [Thalassophryne amazonica]XP_034039065.1 bcl-2-related ovarian killer protein homolog B-like isoform X1 [Thalassophryne amazonica]XP_034039066.1 bcl-2-related ovarian killer protein homolog B-like isoform X1 [Thalassophryne amazonica]XP_034039067.1 bcl-2-related ovarian killer protein homolog B-like isoform X1 [Thalassophryne amazonica]
MKVLRRSSVFAAEVLDVFDRSLTEKELVSQSKALCRDYILSRLNQNSLTWSKTELKLTPSSAALADVSSVLLCLGDELESMQPALYKNVARQLNISVAVENLVSDAFIGVATEIFSAVFFLLAAGITWGKVVSMYAVAGALAVDCVRKGHLVTVYILVDSLGQFVRKFLVPWLKRRGGWVDITKCVVKKNLTPEKNWLSSILESLKYFLMAVYVYIMKEQ